MKIIFLKIRYIKRNLAANDLSKKNSLANMAGVFRLIYSITTKLNVLL